MTPADSTHEHVYLRQRKCDRPVCRRCGRPYVAGSTQHVVTYYYPTCRCVVPNRKVLRRPWSPHPGGPP
jgi:hypothetical protein